MRRAAAPRVSFHETDDFAADGGGDAFSDSDAGSNAGVTARAASSGVDMDDDDRLELVAGGSGAKRKKSSSGAGSGRGRKPGRSKKQRGDDDADDAAAAGSSSSALVNSIARLGAGDDDALAPSLMSSVARRETADHLSYFEQMAQPARKSNSTLKDVPKISEAERARIAAALPVRHAEAQSMLHAHTAFRMREWYMSLCHHFNLLCYGFGSKKLLLNQFARDWLTDAPVIVFNGYAAGAHVKSVLNAITRKLMNEPEKTFANLPKHCEFIREWLKQDALIASVGGRRGLRAAQARGLHKEEEELIYSEDEEFEAAGEMRKNLLHGASTTAPAQEPCRLPKIYLLVHNIDGASLRNDAQQQVLAFLASLPQIRLIASVDHIRSGWLWDRSMLASFNFVSVDCTTFDASYSIERDSLAAAAEPVDGTGVDGQGGLMESALPRRAAGIQNVLSSLTETHRRVLDVLAQEQLTPNNPRCLHSGAGRFHDLVVSTKLYDLLEEGMVVSSLANFRQVLKELRDHDLVHERTVDGTIVLKIPHTQAVIRKQILGQKEEDNAGGAAAAAEDDLGGDDADGADGDVFASAIGLRNGGGGDGNAEEEDGMREAELDAAEEEEEEQE